MINLLIKIAENIIIKSDEESKTTLDIYQFADSENGARLQDHLEHLKKHNRHGFHEKCLAILWLGEYSVAPGEIFYRYEFDISLGLLMAAETAAYNI